MTAADLLPDLPPATPPKTRVERLRSWLRRLDQWAERTGDRLNPILVKEARQALKSHQFVVTFGLLLAAVWGWTMISVVMVGNGAGTREVFAGYFMVLVVPLLVIVPFAAYRSLAAERDDGTFELVSITTLQSRQIVRGKLVSALLQAAVYFSVLAPCIAFTYLLREIDVIVIAISLYYSALLCVTLVALALLLATLSSSGPWQILTTLLLLAGLVWGMGLWSMIVLNELLDGLPPLSEEFWIFNGFLLTMAVTSWWVLLAAATSQLSFASDNRSTRLRVAMFTQHVLYVGWSAYIVAKFVPDRGEAPLLFAGWGVAYWAFAAALMTGERPGLSPRVRRSLPQSVFGRMALSWFMPGSASGYVFAICNLLSLPAACALSFLVIDVSGDERLTFRALFVVSSYAVLYLGLGRLIILALRRVASFGVIVALLMQGLLLALGVLLPLLAHTLVHWNQPQMFYSFLQYPNWAVSSLAAAEDGPLSLNGIDAIAVLIGVPIAATVVLLLNLIAAGREVLERREVLPERVVEEERQLHPERHPTPLPKVHPLDREF